MRFLLFVTCLLIASSVCAQAVPIPGSPNELINGDFETGLLNPWVATPSNGVIVADYGTYGHVLQCDLTTNGWGDTVRQVVDDSKNPLWNWNMHRKVIDLMADICIEKKGSTVGGVRFRLDWWDESYNDRDEPPTENDPGYHVSDWVGYMTGKNDLGYKVVLPFQWHHVNPFNQIVLPIQPRWISVEIEFWQPHNVINKVDNVVLTSKCVPEPSSFVALLLGIFSAAPVATRLRSK